MFYYTIYLMILVTEFSFRILWLILKGMWAVTKWCAHKINIKLMLDRMDYQMLRVVYSLVAALLKK